MESKKNILITGITGFAGSHLAEYLLEQNGVKIFGTHLTKSSSNNISHIASHIELLELDLLNKEKVEEIFLNQKFDTIYHLAALSAPSKSFDDPVAFVTNNIASQINILEGVRKHNRDARVLVISSAEVYGKVSESDLPISEGTPFRPMNPYAVSKLSQDFLGVSYQISYGLDVVRVRPFNHIGPRQAPVFAIPAFCKQIAEIEKGVKKEPVLRVGNISSKRDFTDVRDMVKAYFLAASHGEKGEVYNLGSGKCYGISDILDMLISFSSVKIEIQQDESLLRKDEVPEIVCDSIKFEKLTGWKTEIPISVTLQDTLDYWRNIV